MTSQFPTDGRLDEPVPVSGSDRSAEVLAPLRDVTRPPAAAPSAPPKTLTFEFVNGSDVPLRQVFPVTYDIVLDHDEAVEAPTDPPEHDGEGRAPQ